MIIGRKFGVWCQSSGGVTGQREGWLKSFGAVQLFDTLEEAEAEAARLNAAMNHANSRASFNYRGVAYLQLVSA